MQRRTSTFDSLPSQGPSLDTFQTGWLGVEPMGTPKRSWGLGFRVEFEFRVFAVKAATYEPMGTPERSWGLGFRLT